MLLQSIKFKNLKALRDTTLELQPLTVLVGPNGSGKSTVFNLLRTVKAFAPGGRRPAPAHGLRDPIRSVQALTRAGAASAEFSLSGGMSFTASIMAEDHVKMEPTNDQLTDWCHQLQLFDVQPEAIAQSKQLSPNPSLLETGENLVTCLDQLRDQNPEGFERFNATLAEWLPEFDRVLFDTPEEGTRSLILRTQEGHKIPADSLSSGTLVSLLLIALTHLPSTPSLIGIEEPDRGLHPRMLRLLRDVMERLAYPDRFGDERPPIQVIATTHSPYFIDQFKDYPEQVVVANKSGLDVTFSRLNKQPHLLDIIQDTSLGEAWYSGILGGVPLVP